MVGSVLKDGVFVDHRNGEVVEIRNGIEISELKREGDVLTLLIFGRRKAGLYIREIVVVDIENQSLADDVEIAVEQ